MKQKGQGALEYLLLIGGAIIVAVVVVTLLLNLGSTGGANANSTSMGAVAAQLAATAGNAAPNCNDVSRALQGTTALTVRYIWNNNQCWQILGNYPACTATATDAATNTACCETPNPANPGPAGCFRDTDAAVTNTGVNSYVMIPG